MSLEEQIRKYHEEVLKGRSKKTISNMNKFRKFLFKNQAKEFTDRDRTKVSRNSNTFQHTNYFPINSQS